MTRKRRKMPSPEFGHCRALSGCESVKILLILLPASLNTPKHYHLSVTSGQVLVSEAGRPLTDSVLGLLGSQARAAWLGGPGLFGRGRWTSRDILTVQGWVVGIRATRRIYISFSLSNAACSYSSVGRAYGC